MGQIHSENFYFNYLSGKNTEGVYTLSIDYVGSGYREEKFQRIIEVPCNMSLSALHQLIQHLTGFKDDTIDDLYVASSIRGRKIWLARSGKWETDGLTAFDAPIDQVFVSGTKRKLYYSFEVGDNWIVEIGRKGDKTLPVLNHNYPRIVHARGMRPV
jgi:hypothetical protein